MHTTLGEMLNDSSCSFQFSYQKYWDTSKVRAALKVGLMDNTREGQKHCIQICESLILMMEKAEGFPSSTGKGLSAACLRYVPGGVHSSWALCCQLQWPCRPHTGRNRIKGNPCSWGSHFRVFSGLWPWLQPQFSFCFLFYPLLPASPSQLRLC